MTKEQESRLEQLLSKLDEKPSWRIQIETWSKIGSICVILVSIVWSLATLYYRVQTLEREQEELKGKQIVDFKTLKEEMQKAGERLENIVKDEKAETITEIRILSNKIDNFLLNPPR